MSLVPRSMVQFEGIDWEAEEERSRRGSEARKQAKVLRLQQKLEKYENMRMIRSKVVQQQQQQQQQQQFASSLFGGSERIVKVLICLQLLFLIMLKVEETIGRFLTSSSSSSSSTVNPTHEIHPTSSAIPRTPMDMTTTANILFMIGFLRRFILLLLLVFIMFLIIVLVIVDRSGRNNKTNLYNNDDEEDISSLDIPANRLSRLLVSPSSYVRQFLETFIR